MASFIKQLLAFCVIAGMASAVLHETTHSDSKQCSESHHHHDHDHDHGNLPESSHDHDCAPHHHHCCHIPVADRPSIDSHSLSFSEVRLLEISFEHSLIPDEPFFSLDKPPLI